MNWSTFKRKEKKMKISLHLIRFYTIQLKLDPLIAFFEKIVSRLPHLRRVSDDPAALCYMAKKYNGETD